MKKVPSRSDAAIPGLPEKKQKTLMNLYSQAKGRRGRIEDENKQIQK